MNVIISGKKTGRFIPEESFQTYGDKTTAGHAQKLNQLKLYMHGDKPLIAIGLNRKLSSEMNMLIK